MFAPDGRTLYTANVADKWARAWSVPDGRELRHFCGNAAVYSVAISSDGKLLATGEVGEVVRIWDAATGRLIQRIGPPAAENRRGPLLIRCALVQSFGPDAKTIAAIYSDHGNDLYVWNIETGKEARRLPAEDGSTIALTPDGKLFVVLAGTQLQVFGTARGDKLRTVALASDSKKGIFGAYIGPSGRQLVTQSNDVVLQAWDITTGQELWSLPASWGPVFSRDGQTLAVCRHEQVNGMAAMSLIDAATGKILRRLDGLNSAVCSQAFSPNGKLLAIGGLGLARLWNTATGKEIVPAAGHSGAITTVAVSADGRLTATCSMHENMVRLWDTATGRQIRGLEGHKSGVEEVTISPDGKLLASAAGQQVLIWEVETGRLRHELKDHPAVGPFLRFADDSKTLATGSRQSRLAVWDCSTGKLVRELTSPAHGLAALFSFNEGRLLALEQADVENNDATLRLWDATANRLLRRFTGHKESVNSAVLSADGRMLASRSSDKTIRVWEVASEQERCRFTEPGTIQIAGQWTGTQFLAFSPDCRLLVSCASDDPFARCWDLATRKEVVPLAGHLAWVAAVEFSANGQVLVTGSQDSTSLAWDMASRERKRSESAPRTVADLARLWDDLSDRDAAKAYQALLSLTSAGTPAVGFIGEKLKPLPAVEPAKIVTWIAELDSPQFTVRERATNALLQVADQAEAALRKALETTQSAEVRQRVFRILDAGNDVRLSPDRLREMRALEVLERIGGPAARDQLAVFAAGPPALSLTREARSALRRLGH